MKVLQAKSHRKEGSAAGFRTIRRKSQSGPAAFNPIALLSRSTDKEEFQTKLKVGRPGDMYEQEADRISAQIMTMPEPVAQRQVATEEENEPIQARSLADQITPLIQRQSEDEEEPIQAKPLIQRQAEEEEEPIQEKSLLQRQAEENEEPIRAKGESSGTVDSGLQNQLMSTKGSGDPLSENTRSFMEPRFGRDFSKVRVHTDSNAAQMNKILGAKAFTHGPDIYLNAGMNDTNSKNGQRLIAHELTHVVQQTGGHVQRQENPKGQITRAPEKTIQRAIQDVQQAELSTFFSQPERSLPQPLLDKYLEEPTLMATQKSIIRTLVGRVQRGEAPLSANQFQALVRGQESDLGTALVICHNVTKALGIRERLDPGQQYAINWENVSRDPDPLVYSLDGTPYTFEPANFHPNASEFCRGQESVFYAMLSEYQFGSDDPNDWYHYYAMAAASYYRASRNLQRDDPSQQGPMTQMTGDLVRRVADALRDSAVPSSDAYEGWLLANAMSFLEGGFYGRNQADVDRESNVHIQGASGGLAAVNRIPEEGWKWYVPTATSISTSDFSNFEFRDDMVETIREGVNGNFELTIISGTTPDHWYGTPDPYVKLPGGLFGIIGISRTTTKNDTASPVWNEVIDTLHYNNLNPVTLQLYDEDVLFDDHITDFIDDLRPEGQRSRNFSLTSEGSTLEVRVEATGNVVLGAP